VSLSKRVNREQKKTFGSCRYICRKSCIGRSSRDDVTYFSNGCCNIGCLGETALLGLKVSWWRFSEAEFPLDIRVTLSSLGLLESIICAVGLSTQARDTARQEEERQLKSEKSDCLEEKKMVL
jgi:hypothetical protein